jgi:hypothetical protein
LIYSSLFIIACLVTYGLQFHLGLKRNIPALPLALAMTASVTLFIFFMKLPFIGYDLEPSQIASSRYMMTGAMGTVIALIVSRYVLKVGLQRLDDASLAFPISMGLVKVGCFFAGCCFGIPGGGMLGIGYEETSLAHAYHAMNGSNLVSHHSILIHPVQLYEAFGCAIILASVWFMRRRWTQPGSSFFFLLVLYLPLRFFAEFFRASDLPEWYGLKGVQMVSLLVWMLAILLLRQNEKKSFFSNPTAAQSPALLVGFFLCEIVIYRYFAEYLHFIENVVIVLALGGTGLLVLRASQGWKLIPLYRAMLLPATMGVILFSTAQVSKRDSVRQQQDTISYKSVNLGFSTGNYINTYRDKDGCGALTRDYNQKYFMVGAGFSSYKQVGEKSWELGLSAFGGNQKEIPLSVVNRDEKSYPVVGGHGYAKIDVNWIGLGGGVNIGKLRYAEDRTGTLGNIGHFSTPVMPSLYARIGPRRWFFTQYDFANAFPSSTPANLHQLSIGSGFGARNGFALRFGTPVTHCCSFLSVTVPMQKLSLDAYYNFGNTFAGDPTGSDYDIREFRFSIRYHLNRKE